MTDQASNDRTNQSSTWTRREFVRNTAGVAAVPVALGSFPVPGFANVFGDDRIKVGLIGCGGRGTGAATQALSADPGVVLWAMGDAFADRLASSHKALQDHASDRVTVDESRRFVGFDAYQQVIDSGVDVVILTTPPVFRPMHLKAAIAANKHVFCEKPMAVDGAGVRSVLESAAEAKKRRLSLMSGFCWRYSWPERATFNEILNGRIGQVRAVYTTYNTSGWVGIQKRQPDWSDMEHMLRSWHYFKELSGDHITEQACHSIDKGAWAMGGELPVRCHATGSRVRRTFGNCFDNFAVVYEYASGARAFHMCRHVENTPFDNTDYIMGEKGNCFVNGWGRNASDHAITGEQPWHYPEDGKRENMYQVEHNELFRAIRNNEPVNDGEFMCHSTLMSIMGRMAAYTGQHVTWEQAMNSEDVYTPDSWAWDSREALPVAVPGVTKVV